MSLVPLPSSTPQRSPLDESALISLAAGPLKWFIKDEAFHTSLRAYRASCLGDSNHHDMLDLRVHAQTVERAALEGLDPREARAPQAPRDGIARRQGRGHTVSTAGVPYPRLAACTLLYMSAVSKL